MYLFQIVEVKTVFWSFICLAKKSKILWWDGGLTRQFPSVDMINYSYENFLFKQIKLSQSRFSSSCKLGNSAQFSIKTPIELNTLCFVLMIIHCTSRSCHVIYTNTSVCAQRMGELEFKKIPRKSSTATHCLVIRYFKASLKTILLVLGGK